MSLFLRNSRLLSIVGLIALLCIQSTNSFAEVSYSDCFGSATMVGRTDADIVLSDSEAPYTPQALKDNVGVLASSCNGTTCKPADGAAIDNYVAGMDWYVEYDNGTLTGYSACGAGGATLPKSPYTWPFNSAYSGCLCSFDKTNWYFAKKLGAGSGSDWIGNLTKCRQECPKTCAQYFASDGVDGSSFQTKMLSKLDSCPALTGGGSGGTTNCGDTQYLDGDTCVDKDDAWCASDPNYGSTYYWNVDTCTPKNDAWCAGNSNYGPTYYWNVNTCTPKDDTYCHSIDETYYWDESENDCVENYERYCNDVWFDEGYYWDEIANDCVEKDNAYCIASNGNKQYYYLDGNDCKINRAMFCQIEYGDGYSWNESSGSCQLNLPNCDEATQYLNSNNQCAAKDTEWCENNSNYGLGFYWNGSNSSCEPKNDAWCASNSNYGSGFYWNGNDCTAKNDAWCIANHNDQSYWFWNGNGCEINQALECDVVFEGLAYWNGNDCVDKDTTWCENNPDYGLSYYWHNNQCTLKNNEYCQEINTTYYWNGNGCEVKNTNWCESNVDNNYYWNGSNCVTKDDNYCEQENGAWYWFWNGGNCERDNDLYCEDINDSTYYWNGSSCEVKNNAWCENNENANYYWSGSNCITKDDAYCEQEYGAWYWFWNGGNCERYNEFYCEEEFGANYYWDGSNCAVKNNAWCENNSGSNYYWDGSSCAEKNTAWCQNNYGADYEWVNNTCSAWCENNNAYYLDGGVCTEKNTEWCRSYNGSSYYWNGAECAQIQCGENEIFDLDINDCRQCEDGTRPNADNECVGLVNWTCADNELYDTPNTYFYTSTDVSANPPATLQELISQGYIKANKTNISEATSFNLTNVSDGLNAYLQNQNWIIQYQNREIIGYGSCFQGGWGTKDSTTHNVDDNPTNVYTNHGCACSLDGKNWFGSGLTFANDAEGTKTMVARNAECRRQCPKYCAELVATDVNFRSLVFQNKCPSEQVISVDCGSGKMLFDGQCIPVQFWMTTDVLRNGSYRFTISAAGDFYINWGDGSDTEHYNFDTPEVRTFEKTMETDNPTISLAGNATEYLAGYSAVDFSIDNTSSHITGIHGSLGSIFGTITPGSTSGQPMFKETFANCSGITSEIPTDLFNGVYGETVESMFDGTFRNTNNISGPLPSTLFANLTGVPAERAFYRTFRGSGVFNNGNGEIPANLFAGLDGDVSNSNAAFNSTFAETGVTIVPENLFCYDSDHCLTGGSGDNVFESTFDECNALYGIRKTNGNIVDYVPESMVATMGASDNIFNGTQLSTSCPANMYKASSLDNSLEYLDNEEEDPKPIVTCAQCPSGSVSSAGSESIDDCQPVNCGVNYYMYTDGNGNISCEPCESGTHSPGGQATSCSSGKCYSNEYFGGGNNDNTLMCRTCPNGAVTAFDTNEDAIEAFPEFSTLYENNIVRQGSNENEYLLTSKDAVTVSTYIGDQSWTLTFEDGNTISGYSACFSNVWGKKNTIKTITDGVDVFAHHNCSCSLDGYRWVGSGFAISYDNRPMSERNNLCRQECPAVCAKLAATDTEYRERLYDTNNKCYNESLPIVNCDEDTNGIYPNVGGSDISECYASVKFFYPDPLELIDDNQMYYSAEVVYMDDGYTVSSLPTPLHKEGHRFVGWCEGGTDCDEDTVTTDFTGLRGNKEYYAIYEEYSGPDIYHCEAGYYLDANAVVCNTLCDENNYCEGGDYYYSNEPQGIEHCPSGLVSPEGTVSADHCGKKLHIGDMVLYMTRVQQTHPALAVRLGNTTYYAKTTPVSSGAKSKLRTKIDGIEYSIHDNIMQEVQ